MRIVLPWIILLVAQSHGALADDAQRFLYVLPDGFTGWVCVDFGVAGAPPLPREGKTLLVRPTPGVTMRTSDRVGPVPPTGDARIEANGLRRPLPGDVYGRKMSGQTDTKDPVERYCVFFGTEDAADAAGDAPGLDDSPRMARGVPSEERQALIALYEATGGPQWKHRVGWLGPSGTECSWHGVGCDHRFAESTVVSRLDLSDNNLVGALPNALELGHLESLFILHNRLRGKIPETMLQRWLDGSLEVASDASLLTGVSAIELETEATSLLCMEHRIVLGSNDSARVFTKRCRNRNPGDRSTYCEVKSGRLFPGEFSRLGVLLERNGFFDLRPDYSRMVIDSGGETTRVTRGGVTHQVRNYATTGPMQLWAMQRAIEGVATMVDWENTTSQPECPTGGAAQ